MPSESKSFEKSSSETQTPFFELLSLIVPNGVNGKGTTGLSH